MKVEIVTQISMVIVVRFHSVVRNDFAIFWTFSNFENFGNSGNFADYVVALDFDACQNMRKPAFKRKISCEKVCSRSLSR